MSDNVEPTTADPQPAPKVELGSRLDLYIPAVVDATGAASGYLGPCPEGYEWHIERMTCAQTGAAVAATALLEIFVHTASKPPNDNSKQGRVDIAIGTTVANNVSDESRPPVVPPGYHIVASWTGLTAGDVVSVSTQILVKRLPVGHNRPRHGLSGLIGDVEDFVAGVLRL